LKLAINFRILFILAKIISVNYLGSNLRILRKQKNWTQADLASTLKVNRSLIGAYEEARSEPRLVTLQVLCHLFKVSLEDLLNKPLDKKAPSKIGSSSHLRILPVATEANGEELISLIPQKAAAGYTQGYADSEYIESLKAISLPLPELQQSGTLRIFQIEGDSMLPVQPGAYIIGEFVEDWRAIKNNLSYVLLTLNDGIVYKRVENELSENNRLILKSDNREYKPYFLESGEILELWLAKGVLSFQVPQEQDLRDAENNLILASLEEIKKDMQLLKQKLEQ
jgi:transcriptional regulator with XRE-family HTH domain